MKQIDVAVGVIYDGGRILISQRRQNGTFGDLWEFPGGKFEPSETAEQCLARELWEELGVSVRIAESFPAISHCYPDIAVRLFPYLCTDVIGEPQPLASQQLRWIEPRQLHTFSFPEASVSLIELIIARLCR